jgi:hypothetical protein
MSNGFGAGFFAITLLAVLASLAAFLIIATVASVIYHRRTGQAPTLLRYLFVVIWLGVLGVSGFGVLLLFDEAPAAAWSVTSLVVVPLLAVGVYLARMSRLSPIGVITTTVMAWGVLFLLGVVIVFGVANGIDSVVGLAPAESRQLGVPWIAATAGGLTVTVGMVILGDRFGRMIHSTTSVR